MIDDDATPPSAGPLEQESAPGDRPIIPSGACIACAHVLPFAAWSGDPPIGICQACMALTAPNRGSCSWERGCDCTQAGVSWRINEAERKEGKA
jgi:hypothetical protein